MMGALPDGVFLSAEQWETVQQVLSKINLIEAAVCKKPSKLVGSGEAAQMLDIHPNTLREWFEAGKLPKNLGRGKHLKFERAAIEKMALSITTGRPRKSA